MTSRSAEATIKGYYYQFDATILNLIELDDPTDNVDIEGIEDIDVHTATESTAVQCKYLSKLNFTNSSVREPITLMLDHFRANPSMGLNYLLYAHFENEKSGVNKILALQDLKNILTYKEKKVQKYYHLDNDITDTTLNDFLKKFKLTFGIKFEDQQKIVIQKLKVEFKCSEFEADNFYYNNALRKIIDISILKKASDRNLSKTKFLKSINTASLIFNEWYVRLKSKTTFLQQVRKSILSTKANLASKSRYIVIGKEILDADDSELSFIGLVENSIHSYYRMGYALRDAKPLTFVLDTDQNKLNYFKKQLISLKIPFNDGFENISFSHEVFDAPPIVNVTTGGNKLSKSSYHLRVISFDSLKKSFLKIVLPKVVMNFSVNESLFQRSKDYSLFDVKHCETLKDISNLI